MTLAIRLKVVAELFHTTKRKVANKRGVRASSPCPPFHLGGGAKDYGKDLHCLLQTHFPKSKTLRLRGRTCR